MTKAKLNVPEGLVLVGCGRMGSALLKGWLSSGLSTNAVTVMDPSPSQWVHALQSEGLVLNQLPYTAPSVVIMATKPQVMGQSLVQLREFGNGDTLFLSIAAGTAIAEFEGALGVATPIVRAMPNTPAAIGAGMSALVANEKVTAAQFTLVRSLMDTVGQSVVLESEEQMHAVTALSGSGPAYVFAMAEAMTSAGIKQGLAEDLAQTLAIGTILGAARLMTESENNPAELRRQVTSPAGTTAAGLDVLLRDARGLEMLISATLAAAAQRSRDLGTS